MVSLTKLSGSEGSGDQTGNSGNLVASPLSVSVATAMLAMGAEGNTLQHAAADPHALHACGKKILERSEYVRNKQDSGCCRLQVTQHTTSAYYNPINDHCWPAQYVSFNP